MSVAHLEIFSITTAPARLKAANIYRGAVISMVCVMIAAFDVLLRAKSGICKKAVISLIAAATLSAAAISPVAAASSMTQQGYVELAYSDTTNFTMDGSGRLYVVRDKSTDGAELVRLNQFLEEDACLALGESGVKEIAASPSGKYVYYTKSSGPNNVT